MSKSWNENNKIADLLDRVADLLETQQSNPFRVRSYRDAAETIRDLDEPAANFFHRKGLSGLEEMEGIGEKLAGAIAEIIRTGRLGLIDRLEAEASPQALFVKVPGIGKKLAERIRSELDIETLEELELAAHDGRLEQVEGIGGQRLEGIRNALAGMLSQSAVRKARKRREAKESADSAKRPEKPPVELLLKLDAEYRNKAEKGELKTIAPKRFNPDEKAWLPIMKSRRKGWSFTLLFSNTARAHDLNKTHDWVVIYYARNGDEQQCTVVTSEKGSLAGKRVVRGRERECRDYYRTSQKK